MNENSELIKRLKKQSVDRVISSQNKESSKLSQNKPSNSENTFFIQSLELFNFMCHEKLKIDFNNKITCINGLNGSGKSAVMIAIGIILGIRASQMDRGTLKSLIKRGSDYAVIHLIIYNKNYRTDFFGNKIKLVKNIGTGVFKICDMNNRLFSRKQEDLQMILDYNKINLNMMNFLTQDSSKKFLNASNSKDLYKLFINSTEIEEINSLYEESKNYIIDVQNRIALEEEDKSLLLEKINDKKQILNNLQNVKNNEKEIDDLEDLKIILKINEQEKQIEILGNSLKESEGNKIFKEKELKNLIEEINKEKDKRAEILQLNKKYQADLAEFISKKNDKRKEIEFSKMEIESDLQMLAKDNEERKNELENFLKLTVDNKKEYEKKILENQEKKEKKEILFSNISEDLSILENFKEKETKERQEIDKTIFAIQKQIKFYEDQNLNQLAFFGKNMKNILKEIKENKFSDSVIGPIGLFLDIKDPKYAQATTMALQKRLSSFIVFNQKDNILLSKIFRKYKANYPVIKPKRKHLGIKFQEKNTKYFSILKILKFKAQADIIRDNLIMFDNIESTYLSDNRREAYDIYDAVNPDCVYTRDGDKIKKINGTVTEFRPRNTRVFFKSNQVEHLKKKLEIYENKEIERPDEIISIQKKYKNFEKVNLNNLIEFLKKEESNLKENIEELENTLKEQQIHFDLLERETNYAQIEENKKIMQKIENQIKINEHQISSIKSEYEELGRKILMIDREIEIEKNKTSDKLKSLQYNSRDFYLEKMTKENEINQLTNFCLQLKNELEDKKSHLNDFKDSNKNITTREGYFDVHNYAHKTLKENLDSINSKISFLHKQNEVIKENKFDLEDETENLKKLKKRYESKKNLIENHNKMIQKNLEDNRMRIQKMEELKEKISIETNKNFIKNTAVRNYVGRLVFDHDDKTLEIFMQTSKIKNENDDDNFGGKDTLSGGERSFAGICLLLSLYEFIKAPLKILDEFDVFMDNLNRTSCFKLIFEFFSKREDQIILITPLGFKGFDCEVVTIHKK